MAKQVGSVPIILPGSLGSMNDFGINMTPNQGELFHWHFSGAIPSVAGNSQLISPFIQFQTPFPCSLNEVKCFVDQFDATNLYNAGSRFQFLIFVVPLGGGEPIISSPINQVGPGPSQPILIRFMGSTFNGENQFPRISGVQLKPGVTYEIDIIYQDVVNAANTLGVDVLLTLQKT